MISNFEAGGAFGSSPMFFWSPDESELLVSRNHTGIGYVVAYDVAQAKCLGTYQTKAPGGSIESLSFSEDGRSVTIKRADGESEVWAPPPLSRRVSIVVA
jgi:hypothetical protein